MTDEDEKKIFIHAAYSLPIVGLMRVMSIAEGEHNMSVHKFCEGGMVTIAGDGVLEGETYEKGTSVTVNVMSNDDYEFVKWREDWIFGSGFSGLSS